MPTDKTMTLSNYESMGAVASALYGDVYKLRHRATGEMVALKHMDLRFAAARRTKDSHKLIEEDVVAEVQTNMKLRALGGHAHVVAMCECLSDDQSVALLTEWCDKGELLQVVNSRGSMLSIELAMRYFYQITQGLAFLHSNGIAHRDLSLENVLVDGDDVCKISDFGMATPSTRVRATGIGKIHYMAPEACRDLDRDDSFYNPFEADMWALGVILLTMLTGQYPFDHALESDANVRQLANFGIQHLLDRLDFETEGCEDIVDVLGRLLAVDPALRPTAEELLRHECFDVFLVSDDEQFEDEGAEEDIYYAVGDEEMNKAYDAVNINPAEKEDGEEDVRPASPVFSFVPPRAFQYSTGGLFAQRRPAPIDISPNRASCTFVSSHSSRKSPVVLKQDRADTGGSPKLRTSVVNMRSRCSTKKCVFRGMLDGVFRRKKARATTSSSSSTTSTVASSTRLC